MCSVTLSHNENRSRADRGVFHRRQVSGRRTNPWRLAPQRALTACGGLYDSERLKKDPELRAGMVQVATHRVLCTGCRVTTAPL